MIFCILIKRLLYEACRSVRHCWKFDTGSLAWLRKQADWPNGGSTGVNLRAHPGLPDPLRQLTRRIAVMAEHFIQPLSLIDYTT